MFEILSGVALDLKNRTATHQLGNLSPPSTKLSLQKNTTETCSISQSVLNTNSKWVIDKLTSPSSNSSFSCLDQREEAPEAEAEVFVGDLNRQQCEILTLPRCTRVKTGRGTERLTSLPWACREHHLPRYESEPSHLLGNIYKCGLRTNILILDWVSKYSEIYRR